MNRTIKKVIEFVRGQQKPFKVDLVRASANTFLTRLTWQYRSVYILMLVAMKEKAGTMTSSRDLA